MVRKDTYRKYDMPPIYIYLPPFLLCSSSPLMHFEACHFIRQLKRCNSSGWVTAVFRYALNPAVSSCSTFIYPVGSLNLLDRRGMVRRQLVNPNKGMKFIGHEQYAFHWETVSTKISLLPTVSMLSLSEWLYIAESRAQRSLKRQIKAVKVSDRSKLSKFLTVSGAAAAAAVQQWE